MHRKRDESRSGSPAAPLPADRPGPRRRVPWTLWTGLLYLLACDSLLFFDVVQSDRGAVRTQEEIALVRAAVPDDALGRFARFVAVNMTPLAWPGFILLIEGALAWRNSGGSPLRRRPHHFATLSLASVSIWCLFDWINFYSIDAWRYIGMPTGFWSRAWGYLLAFATIVPGMLLCGQLLLDLGWFDWARSPAWRMPRWAKWASLTVGTGMFFWPIVHRDPITNLTLWASLVFMLDPINLKLGRPSMFRDWQAGWYGRTLAAFAGGLLCGLLWEFWNYWALAKWTYNLPFLGAWEQFRYFEMPVIGLLGFLPFGQACWVVWQTLRLPLDGLVEPLPDERTLV